MVDFLRIHQTEIMYVLSGICVMIAVFACITKYPSKKRKLAQLVMAISSVILLVSEILGEVFFGVTTQTGYWMVRICNFLIYLTTLFVVHSFNLYLIDMFRVDLKMLVPKRLKLVLYLTYLGEILVIISPFTGLYYTFDEMNRYHRSSLYPVSYIVPLISIVLLLSVIIGFRKKIRAKMWIILILFAMMPLAAAIIQFYISDIYITDMAIVVMVVLLYIFTLLDTNGRLENAQMREIQMLLEDQEHTRKLFTETAIALVDAIEAKDRYTQGHSTRVAEYSRMIATLLGKSEDECNDIYYAALLHDVGKIGVPDSVINKKVDLTSEELGVIRKHAMIGYQILSEISDFPYLAMVARNHHERFDGAGYPDGLKGKDIPEFARIISVADAYDAMTSNRSYREQLTQENVREEFLRCSGTQFDPDYVDVMIRLIDQDTEYTMREQ